MIEASHQNRTGRYVGHAWRVRQQSDIDDFRLEVQIGHDLAGRLVARFAADGADNAWLPILAGDVEKENTRLIAGGGEFAFATMTGPDRVFVQAKRA